MSENIFIGPNFLLGNATAQYLFHKIAKNLPIVDYHNHLDVSHLALDKKYNNITELWLISDPYKHRAMRINGVPEKYITGDSTDKEKFLYWAKTLPKTVGNPLFHWSCLELKLFFDIDEMLNEVNAESMWNTCNNLLQSDSFTSKRILEKLKVDTLCTSDGWFSNLTLHKTASTSSSFKVMPSLRTDFAVNTDFWKETSFLKKLSEFSKIKINSFTDFKNALLHQIHYFNDNGCVLADQALDSNFMFLPTTDEEASGLFSEWMRNEILTEIDKVKLECNILIFLGKSFTTMGWTLQLHIGAHRRTSSRLLKLAGSAGGFATIGSTTDVESICSFINQLEIDNGLPNIILFALNPSDNETFATLTGSFAQDGVIGKIKFGPAWWYNDHIDGIRSHLLSCANYSLLSSFVGFTTDSRSILSFSRHEYFRRILCNLVGEQVESGLMPNNEILLKNLITDLSYANSKKMILNG